MLIPCSARAEGESNGSDEVTFTCISANPEGFYHEEDNFEYFETVDERAHNLFDGNTDTKWCFDFSQKAYVIFKASRLGAVSGYTITTGNDSGDYAGRNPKSWTLYGSNDQENWTIIDQVSNDVVLQDENATAYNYNCSSSAEYEYFKWEITEGGSTLQVSELKLKLEKRSVRNIRFKKYQLWNRHVPMWVMWNITNARLATCCSRMPWAQRSTPTIATSCQPRGISAKTCIVRFAKPAL